jgi:small subunit ribosomal protein S6
VRKYECAVILLPTLASDVLESTNKKYTDVITSNGGTLSEVDDWGKRSLAYEINDHREGYYRFYRFNGGAEVLSELNRQLRIDENVLRHMIVKDDAPPPQVRRTAGEGTSSAEPAAEEGR